MNDTSIALDVWATRDMPLDIPFYFTRELRIGIADVHPSCHRSKAKEVCYIIADLLDGWLKDTGAVAYTTQPLQYESKYFYPYKYAGVHVSITVRCDANGAPLSIVAGVDTVMLSLEAHSTLMQSDVYSSLQVSHFHPHRLHISEGG